MSTRLKKELSEIGITYDLSDLKIFLEEIRTNSENLKEKSKKQIQAGFEMLKGCLDKLQSLNGFWYEVTFPVYFHFLKEFENGTTLKELYQLGYSKGVTEKVLKDFLNADIIGTQRTELPEGKPQIKYVTTKKGNNYLKRIREEKLVAFLARERTY